MSGDSWASAVSRPVMKYYPGLTSVFVSFFVLVGLTLLNVMTAVVVDNVLKAASDAEAEHLERARDELKSTLASLSGAFEEADSDADVSMSREEFLLALRNHGFQNLLFNMGIRVEEMDQLFSTLDDDGSGFLSHDEFVNGCLQLRGTARGKDLLTLSTAVRQHRSESSSRDSDCDLKIAQLDERVQQLEERL